MKDGLVSIRTAAHTRLIAQRASQNTIRTPNTEVFEQNSSVSKSKTAGLLLKIREPNVNLLVEPTPTSSNDKHPAAKTHSNSLKMTTMTVSPSASATSEALVSRSHVSGVAMGLAFGLVGFAALVIVIVWAVRRHKAKLDSPVARWKRNPFTDMENMTEKSGTNVQLHRHPTKKSEGYSRLKDDKLAPAPVSSMTSIHSDTHSSFLAQSMLITPPGNTFNNPVRPTSAVSLTSNSVMKQREFTKVLKGFLPTLPDELQIHQGEVIEIINSFDDGWALCLNQHGEKGVVPLECLSRDAGKDELNPPGGGAYRLSKRASSLYAGISSDSY